MPTQNALTVIIVLIIVEQKQQLIVRILNKSNCFFSKHSLKHTKRKGVLSQLIWRFGKRIARSKSSPISIVEHCANCSHSMAVYFSNSLHKYTLLLDQKLNRRNNLRTALNLFDTFVCSSAPYFYRSTNSVGTEFS